MIVNPTEQPTQDKVDQNLVQPKVESNSSQQNIDANSSQQDESDLDPNWKRFREARKKDKAEKEAAEKRAAEKEAEATALKAAMEAAFSKQSASRNTSYDNEEVEPTEDERIEKKVQVALAAREAQYQKDRYEREKNELPQKLLQAFPDYNQVVNEENGAYLEYHHPELYRSLLRQPENFETCSDIYKVVKKLIPNSTTAKKEAIRADNNFNKPKSISSTGMTQPGEAKSSSILSEERKQQNWERMERIRKGLN